MEILHSFENRDSCSSFCYLFYTILCRRHQDSNSVLKINFIWSYHDNKTVQMFSNWESETILFTLLLDRLLSEVAIFAT